MKISASIMYNKWQWCIPLVAILICLGTLQNFFSLLAFAICIVVIVCASNQSCLCMMVFLLPFANVFKTSPDAQSFFTYLLLLYVLRCVIAKRKTSQRFAVLFVLMVVYTVCQVFMSFNALRMVKFYVNFLFLYYALDEDIKKCYRNVFLFYIFGVVGSSVIAWLGIFPDLYSYVGEKSQIISGITQARFAGMYPDPNYYAINVIISLCLVVLLYHYKEIKSTLAVVLSALLVVFAIATYSRSAFIMLILPIVLLLYSRVKKRRYFAFALATIAVVVFLVSAFGGKFAFLEPIFSRFNDSTDVNSLTSGRTDIWMNYIQFFSQDPFTLLFGKGMGATLVGGDVAHNTYIDLTYHLGLVGSSLFVGLLFVLFRNVSRNSNKNLCNYGVLLAVLIMYFFLSELFYVDLAFHILVVIMAMKLPTMEEEECSCGISQAHNFVRKPGI